MIKNTIGSVIENLMTAIEGDLIEVRRDLHAHPELAFEEVRTSRIVADRLTRIGVEHRTKIGRTGVLGTIDTGRPGRTLLLRADMDALPIEEQTGLEFASQTRGKMHACGHDLHTATLLGVAEILEELKTSLTGKIILMFQPAEETSESGAAAMIAEGALDGVDMALGFHNYPDEAVGSFSFIPGTANGSSDEFEILIHGRSGHAARPNLAADPIVAAATLILQLQTIVSREVDPMHPAVLTIGAIEAGKTENIIPGLCRIIGTVRTQHHQDRDLIQQAIRRQCAGVSYSMNVTCDFTMVRGVPSLLSDADLMDKTMRAIKSHFGAAAVTVGTPSLAAEDFALIGERVPAFQLGIGSATPGRDDKLHNSDYQPDERCIRNGVVALTLTAFEILSDTSR